MYITRKQYIVWVLIIGFLFSGCSATISNSLPLDDEPVLIQTESEPTQELSSPTPSPEVSLHEPLPSELPEVLPGPSDPPKPPPEDLDDGTFVRVQDYIPDIVIDLKYATDDNFMGITVYDFGEAYLRFGTVKKLRVIQEELRKQGLGLKIWDAFRPVAVQFTLWEVVPDSRYVANPHTGYSNHSRGNTIDVTLIDVYGNEQEMPTGFDEFTALAGRDYINVPEAAAQNAMLLQTLMYKHGFWGASTEWWHYTDSQTHPVEHEFTPATVSLMPE